MKKKFCVLQKKVLSFGPNPTVEVRPNRMFYWCILSANFLEFAWMLIVALVLTSGINQDFIVVRAVLDNFIILLEFLVIIWNDPNYLLDLFGLSAFQFLVIKSLSFFLWITRHEVPAVRCT